MIVSARAGGINAMFGAGQGSIPVGKPLVHIRGTCDTPGDPETDAIPRPGEAGVRLELPCS